MSQRKALIPAEYLQYIGIVGNVIVVVINWGIVYPSRLWELVDDGLSICFPHFTTAFVGEEVCTIVRIGNKPMFNEDARNAGFASAANYGEFVARFHLLDKTI